MVYREFMRDLGWEDGVIYFLAMLLYLLVSRVSIVDIINKSNVQSLILYTAHNPPSDGTHDVLSFTPKVYM